MNITLHLISDSTGDTLNVIADSVVSQFKNLTTEKKTWPMIRTKAALAKVMKEIESHPGMIFYTMFDQELEAVLKQSCANLKLPCVPVLAKVISELSNYLHMKTTPIVGRHKELDEDYFARVEAITYTLNHDDGQQTHDLNDADIILVGVSRTSKSPTSVYLANKGYKVANIPYVSMETLPTTLFSLTKPFVVGLTINVDRLIQIRTSRVEGFKDTKLQDYIDYDRVQNEILEARKLCTKMHWPVIDVTKRAVEETAALIIQYHNARRINDDNKQDH